MDDKPTISRESFNTLTNKDKLNILYDYMVRMHQHLIELEKRKKIMNIYAILAGCTGGAIAWVGSKISTILK